MALRATEQLRQNLKALLLARGVSQKSISMRLKTTPSMISKFLKGTRGLNMEMIDVIADELGVESYQLFTPGIATERRSGFERRSGEDRRKAHLKPEAKALMADLARVGYPPPPAYMQATVTPDEMRLIRLLRSLPDTDRKAVEAIIDTVGGTPRPLKSASAPTKKPRRTNPDG